MEPGVGQNAGTIDDKRHIDPRDGQITFVNDDPKLPATDNPVDRRLASTIERAVDVLGCSLNINSTTGGHLTGAHPIGKAADINYVNRMLVSDPRNVSGTYSLFRAF